LKKLISNEKNPTVENLHKQAGLKKYRSRISPSSLLYLPNWKPSLRVNQSFCASEQSAKRCRHPENRFHLNFDFPPINLASSGWLRRNHVIRTNLARLLGRQNRSLKLFTAAVSPRDEAHTGKEREEKK
jgi:hypothetical protein